MIKNYLYFFFILYIKSKHGHIVYFINNKKKNVLVCLVRLRPEFDKIDNSRKSSAIV